MFAEIILTKNTKAIDMAFTYAIPEDMNVRVGQRVIVPFGIGNRLTEGFVIGLCESAEIRTKAIHQVVPGLSLSEQQITLVKFLKDTYLASYSEALTTIVPSGTKLSKSVTFYKIKDEEVSNKQQELLDFLSCEKDEVELLKHFQSNMIRSLEKKGLIKKRESFKQDVNIQYKKVVYANIDASELEKSKKKLTKTATKQKQVLDFIVDVSVVDLAFLRREFKVSNKAIDKLLSLNFIKIEEEEKYRKPDALKKKYIIQKHALNEEQKVVFNRVKDRISSHHKYLLHGVTGSGKTEVYMALAEEVLALGKQVIMLVPEIALTPQMVGKFLKRFGNHIGVIHSKMSPGERYDTYRAIESGLVSVVIGARSAIFSPCPNLGLVIIDEEHESTYKSDTNPKYSTQEVAEKITGDLHIPLIVASATPSITTYYQSDWDYDLLELKNRYNEGPMPPVYLVDMREELMSGNKSMFSELLIEKIQEKLEKKEQIILFYNRKGHSTFVSCRMCGYALKCPNCDIALTYHHHNKEAKCSYCDYKIKVPKHCPECDSTYFKYFGTGTEKIETMLNELFPQARIGRLDSESTSRKGQLEKIIDQVEQGKIDILIGTQMVTKGLDFLNVTLVGALSADISLNLPDYRAPEKTFQLLTQVAGRAGRGEKAGEVIIQTYTPEHYAIVNAVEHDYHSFYKEECALREAFHYPPYKEIVNILIVGENEDNLIRSAHNLSQEITRFIYTRIKKENIEILGPNPALFSKINKKYRWQIILKFDKMDMLLMKNILHYVCIKHKDKVVMSDVYISININPMSLL